MNLIELHILQSFPVTCLNRDDVGAPKSAFFGGVQRARVSSQCWKRAIRAMAKSLAPDTFAGQRTCFVLRELRDRFTAEGCSEDKAKELSEATADVVGTLDDLDKGTVKTLLFFSPQELAAVVRAVLSLDLDNVLARKRSGDKKTADEAQKELQKKLRKPVQEFAAVVKDAADIAIFGRMVADDHTLTVEGAGLFSHALSTHAVANEVDFFTAVDDAKVDTTDAGAGHLGTLEFNAACYYRYVGLNTDLLTDSAHLGHLSHEERSTVVDAFLRGAILAVPSARKNSMFGFTPPTFVLGLHRQGQPLSLVNAFESPVPASGGYVARSEAALQNHWKRVRELYCLKTDTEAALPPENLDAFIAKLNLYGDHA